jgi:DNA repair exonuclease SbcCD ATPase subunit
MERRYKDLEKKIKRLIDHFHSQKDIKRNNEVLAAKLKSLQDDNDKLVQDTVAFTKQNISWQHELQSARSRVHELIKQRNEADGLVKQMHAKYDDAKDRLHIESKKVVVDNKISDMEKIIQQMDNALKNRNSIIQDASEKLKLYQSHPSNNDLVIGALHLLEYKI